MSSLSNFYSLPSFQVLSPNSPSKSHIKTLIPPTFQFLSKPRTQNFNPCLKHKTQLVPLATNLKHMGFGNQDEPSNKFDPIKNARNVFAKLPLPVKNFPWDKMIESFLRLAVEIVFSVIKYLSVPVLAISQLSEMSYCAHEKKLSVVPIMFVVGFVVGFVVCGVLKDVEAEFSSGLKEGSFPWHLLLNAIIFALLKLPGPCYPYWGRLLIPHFANGGLWASVWFAFIWYNVPRSASLGSENGCML